MYKETFMNENPLIVIKGYNGNMHLYNDRIFIDRKSIVAHFDAIFLGAKTSLNYEQVIYYSEIKSVKYMKATIWKNGYISLVIEGELKNIDGVRDAAKDASSLIFYPEVNDFVEKAVGFIKHKINENVKNDTNLTSYSNEVDISSEIQKLFDLKTKGIISEEEFAQAKKKLLS